jgi:hypothetical protein
MEIGQGVFKEKAVLAVKLIVRLAFEQQRFYNPHHHPEMPRTLQSLGRRVGYGEDYSRYTMIGLCFVLGISDPGKHQ